MITQKMPIQNGLGLAHIKSQHWLLFNYSLYINVSLNKAVQEVPSPQKALVDTIYIIEMFGLDCEAQFLTSVLPPPVCLIQYSMWLVEV